MGRREKTNTQSPVIERRTTRRSAINNDTDAVDVDNQANSKVGFY